MLVLSRRLGEEIVIDSHIRVTVLSVKKGRIRIGIAAPDAIAVDRAEVHNRRMEFVIAKGDDPTTPNSSSNKRRVQ